MESKEVIYANLDAWFKNDLQSIVFLDKGDYASYEASYQYAMQQKDELMDALQQIAPGTIVDLANAIRMSIVRGRLVNQARYKPVRYVDASPHRGHMFVLVLRELINYWQLLAGLDLRNKLESRKGRKACNDLLRHYDLSRVALPPPLLPQTRGDDPFWGVRIAPRDLRIALPFYPTAHREYTQTE
jgi:hypothetical protein